MYSDTHFHFKSMCQGEPNLGGQTLEEYSKSRPYFALDIGTRCDDLFDRFDFALKSMEKIPTEIVGTVKSFLHYSAGIWPDVGAIKDRFRQMEILKKNVEEFLSKNPGKLVAIGECGLDHHWNPKNPDARNEADFDSEIYQGEREMFLMQLDFAKKLNLPVIIHSRDAFEETLECIDQSSYHNGIIHCYSYGLSEAKQFLDRGWHLAFGGAVTYTKKKLMPQMEELLRFVPKDRLLLETDAPYLSPVPLRGTPNTPVNIPYSYSFIAKIRGESVEDLCQTVDDNARNLFGLADVN